MSQLDVLFISPNNSQLYGPLAKKFSAIEPPTWALLLAGSCRKQGYSVAILDCDVLRLGPTEAVKNIEDHNPKLVCFVGYGQNPNSGTTSMQNIIEIATELDSKYKTMVIGSHASALPEEVLSYKCIDFISINEGVKCLLSLLKTNLVDDLDKVPALGYKTGIFKRINNGAGSLVEQDEMDELMPGYAWDLIPSLDKYRCHNWLTNYDTSKRSPYAAIYSSLGCSYKCDHCMINIVNRTSNSVGVASSFNKMRYWSPTLVLKWLQELIEVHNCYNIRFSDEMFFLNKKYYQPILEGIIENGWGKHLISWTYARVDTINQKFLDLFSKAGIKYLAVGFEHANQEVRRENTKGKFENVDIRRIVKEVENVGINIGANWIFGMPNEKLEHLQETLDLAIELNTGFCNMYTAMALPGSPLYAEAKNNGWKLPSTFSGYGFLSYDIEPLPTKYLTAKEVLTFRDKAWHTYFEHPTYLSKIESKYGTHIRNSIEEQTKIKLKRKILGD